VKPYTCFIDTNVMYSAIYNKNGVPSKIIFSNIYCLRLISSKYAYRELSRLLQKRPIPNSLPSKIELEQRVEFFETPDFEPDHLNIRKKDLPILRGAQYLDSDFLVTGDVKDFYPYMHPSFALLTKIVTPTQLCRHF